MRRRLINGSVVLVGRSQGGAVVTRASAGQRNVIGLVFVAVFAPDEGENSMSSQELFLASLLASTAVPTPCDAPGAAGGPDLYISAERFRETFCADVPVDLA